MPNNDIKPFYVHEVYPSGNYPTMKEMIDSLKRSKELTSTYPVDSLSIPTEDSIYKNGASLTHFLIAIVGQKDNVFQPSDEDSKEITPALSSDLTYIKDYQILYVLRVNKIYNQAKPESLDLKEIVEERKADLQITPVYNKLFEALRRPRPESTQVQQVVDAIQKLYQIPKTIGESFRKNIGKLFNMEDHKKELIKELDTLKSKKEATADDIKAVLLNAKFKSTENQLLTQAILTIMDLSAKRPLAKYQNQQLAADSKQAQRPK